MKYQLSTKKITDKQVKNVYNYLNNYRGINDFICDLSELTKQGHSLSEKQIRCVLRFIQQISRPRIYRSNIK